MMTIGRIEGVDGVRWELGALAVLVLGALMLGACGQGASQQSREMPPRTVVVENPRRGPIADVFEFPAQLEAVERVEVRARVEGRLEAKSFEPRSVVDAGQLLFRIESDRYVASVTRAKAEVQRAQARAAEAEATLQRFEKALERRAISELEVLQQRAARDTTQADVVAAEAALRSAELDLEYSQVRSPIRGRISRTLVDVGNIVGSLEPTLLATIVRTDRVFAYFRVDEQTVLTLRRRNLDRAASQGGANPTPVALRLQDEDTFDHRGVVDYVAPELDAASGTVEVRAVFDNPDQLLLPGFFGYVRLIVEPNREGLMVPVRAIGRDVGGPYVMVVGDDDVVATRPIELGEEYDDGHEVLQGLEGDERVIVDGINVVRPGDRVTPPVGRGFGHGGGVLGRCRAFLSAVRSSPPWWPC